MAILAAGAEPCFFKSNIRAPNPAVSYEIVDQITPVTTRFDPIYSRGGIPAFAFQSPAVNPTNRWLDFTETVEKVFFHFEFQIDIGFFSGYPFGESPIIFFRKGTRDVYRVITRNRNAFVIQFLNTSNAWADVLSKSFVANSAKFELDIGITPGVAGNAFIAINGDITATVGTITSFPDNEMDNVLLSFSSGFSSAYFSQVIVADESTIGYKLMTQTPTGDASTFGWLSDANPGSKFNELTDRGIEGFTQVRAQNPGSDITFNFTNNSSTPAGYAAETAFVGVTFKTDGGGLVASNIKVEDTSFPLTSNTYTAVIAKTSVNTSYGVALT